MYGTKDGVELSDRRAVAEIDLDVLAANAAVLQKMIGSSELMCVVKANAYGHGAVTVSKFLESTGVKNFGVATGSEGLELRENDVEGRILVFSHVPVNIIPTAIENGLTFAVASGEYGLALAEIAASLEKKAKVHIKIDTGMARIGFHPNDESLAVIKKLAQEESLELEGIFSHLAVAKPNNEFSVEQLGKFNTFVRRLEGEGIHFACKHIANSGGILSDSRFHLDMARAGIILYGYSPDDDKLLAGTGIEPPLTLRSYVSSVKTVEAGTSIGYCRTYVTDKKTAVATLPIGYADGYSRLLSNRGSVLIKGKKSKIIGNICMDMIMADVTGIEGVSVGDEAVLLGKQGTEEIRGRELSDLMGTIEYELLTGISQRVQRVYEG